MKRTLRLRAESLTELTSHELGGVAGAQQDLSLFSCPVLRCLATYPLNDCVVVNPPTLPPTCYSTPWC
jgi:hypothetical protein